MKQVLATFFALTAALTFPPPSTAAADPTLLAYAPGAAVPGLYNIDSLTGTASFLTSVSPPPTPGGMGFLGGTLYMVGGNVAGNSWAYGTVNISTGSFSSVGAQTSGNWEGFAPNQAAGLFYTVDLNNGDKLLSVVPGGAITTIGSGSPLDLRGLTYDDVHGVLYATDYYSGIPNLYRIDTTTGVRTLIGSLGFSSATAGGDIPLYYNSSTGILYANNAITRALYSVNTTTGLATMIGVDGLPVASLALAPIPEPASYALMLAGLGFVGLALGRRGARLSPIHKQSCAR